MNVFTQIWDRVLSLFGRKGLNKSAQRKARVYTDDYEQTEKINFTSIFATALANKAVSDSTVAVKDGAGNQTRRSEWLNDGIQKVWSKSKPLVSQTLGKGGKVLVPYVRDGKPFVDIIDQSRMAITAMRGYEIVGATLMADIASLNGKVFYRFADYSLEGTTHTIRYRATNDVGGEVELSIIPEWAELQPEIVVNGAEHVDALRIAVKTSS